MMQTETAEAPAPPDVVAGASTPTSSSFNCSLAHLLQSRSSNVPVCRAGNKWAPWEQLAAGGGAVAYARLPHLRNSRQRLQV